MPASNQTLTAAPTRPVVLQPKYVVPFILTTTCFVLWGFANDITNPMVKAFSTILRMSNFEGSLVQFAFYGGYFAMAFPAAMFIRKFSYKAGLLVGLGLYGIGAALFIPASSMMVFWPFLIAYFVLTCGLSFLETSANPYILSMGPAGTATRRLNFAQAFNPIGSLLGMLTAQQFILARLNPASAAERDALPADELRELTAHDLAIIRDPYVGIGLVILIMFVVIAMAKMPRHEERDRRLDLIPTLRRLALNRRYLEGVVAQAFYVGAQIMCWTFIIHYGVEMGLTPTQAQGYNIVAMVVFCFSRFVCTYLLKFFSPGKLLFSLALGGAATIVGTILVPGMAGLWCLVGTSACMSLMFPTIYGIALHGIGDDAKFGAAGLIMAILGGSVMPPLQAAVIDLGTVGPLTAVRASFALPLVCFVVIALYGYRSAQLHLATK